MWVYCSEFKCVNTLVSKSVMAAFSEMERRFSNNVGPAYIGTHKRRNDYHEHYLYFGKS